MKVSIVPPDGIIYIDGQGYFVKSVEALKDTIHAVQWDGDDGEIEFVQVKGEEFKPHEKINNMRQFQSFINEALKEAETPTQPTLMPLDMFAYKQRQQLAFSQARTTDFGVQYSDPTSIGMLTALVALFDKGLLTGPINYKGPNGFVSLGKDQITALAAQVAGHIQKYFNAEKAVLEQIQMGTITTHAQIVDAFKAVK